MRSSTGLLMASNKSYATNVSNGNLRMSFTRGANPKMDYSGIAKCA
jgi:hypothetical protein